MINAKERDLIQKINENWSKTHGDIRSTVLVSHLCIEYTITKIIEQQFTDPSVLDELNFSIKLKILDGLGVIDKKSIRNIRILGRVRNLFVHTLEVNSKEFDDEFMKQIKHLSFYDRLEKLNLQYPENYFSFATSMLLKFLFTTQDEPITRSKSTDGNTDKINR